MVHLNKLYFLTYQEIADELGYDRSSFRKTYVKNPKKQKMLSALESGLLCRKYGYHPDEVGSVLAYHDAVKIEIMNKLRGK